MSRKNHYRVIWYLIEFRNKYRAFSFKTIHNKFIMDDFVTHVDGMGEHL